MVKCFTVADRHDVAWVRLVWNERCLMSTCPGQRFPGASSCAPGPAVPSTARSRAAPPPR